MNKETTKTARMEVHQSQLFKKSRSQKNIVLYEGTCDKSTSSSGEDWQHVVDFFLIVSVKFMNYPVTSCSPKLGTGIGARN